VFIYQYHVVLIMVVLTMFIDHLGIFFFSKKPWFKLRAYTLARQVLYFLSHTSSLPFGYLM
jgi:hypothetical protein